MQEIHRKYNAIIASAVFIISFIIFLSTVAPTLAFWDCGEYVAASESLGVPHPPGNPMFVLLGRVFSMVFSMFRDTGFRINLISVFSSAFTAVFLYLTVVRVMVKFVGFPDTAWKRLTVYISGAVGAFYGVFGSTFWFSAVESEVNAASMLITSVCIWLSIVWAQSTDSRRDRLLVLFVYLAYLGIGIHMFTMLALIPVFPFIMLIDKEKRKDWRLWVCAALMGTVIYGISTFIWIGPLLTVVTGVMSAVSAKSREKWRFAFFIVLFAMLGYSVHLFIPIRSALNPIIDENHPVVEFTDGGIKWDAFKGFLERKQYGSESMISRMFWRRGSWEKQFGIDSHMGFGGFYITQFFHFGKSVDTDRSKTVFENWGSAKGAVFLVIYLLPTALMIFGWYYLFKRNRNEAMMLLFLVVLTTVVLVYYHNFADGHHAEKRDYTMWERSGKQGPMPTVHREVRCRDYFYTPGFMFVGMWIGIAAGCLLHALYNSKNRFLRTNAGPVLSVLFAVSPVLPITQNYAGNNRSKDWIPFDYAFNLLMSCKKDGILITNGDNDTFPLWALQEAYGIRRDIRIVNLSLINTKWYIRQMKNLEPKVPITFTEAKIDALDHEINPLSESIPYTLSSAGITVRLPGRKDMNAWRIQDKMVLHMVDVNKWRKPIYFAVTVSNDNMMGMQDYLQMQGMVYEIQPKPVPADRKIDLERTEYLLDKVYRFRGLGSRTEPMNETAEKLLTNYAASFIQMAMVLRQPLMALKNETGHLAAKAADTTALPDSAAAFNERVAVKRAEYQEMLSRTVSKLDQCVSLMPWDWRPRALRHEILMAHDRYDEALVRIREARIIDPSSQDYMKMEAQALEKTGKTAEAAALIRELAKTETDSWESYAYLSARHEQSGNWDSAIMMMQEYLQMHPGDRRATAMINRYRTMGQPAKQ